MAERKLSSKEESLVQNAIKDYEKQKSQATEKKKIEPVVKGKVKTKKRSGIKKVTDLIVSDDVSNIKNYILMDVIVPAAKKAISDVVTSGIDMLLYGESGRSSKRSSNKISYSSYYDRDRRDSGRTVSGNRYSNRFDIDEIILETRAEAEEVLLQMDQLIDNYKMVSVADLYDLVGMSCDYTAQKYGWTNIRNAEVVRVRDGYRLKLPKILPID